ncbi:MAG: hypothetical protein MUD08_04900 [Cytophagales bacterium]|jgi:hypothetical protein|nr:hypothetical protein [Cytophagales bacterium]
MEYSTVSNPKGEEFFHAYHNADENLIHCQWMGFVNDIEAAKQACLAMVSLIRQTQCPNLLNDNRLQTGPWPPINDWLQSVWIPQMANAGLRHFAHIHSENFFTELSAKRVLTEQVGELVFQHFKDEAVARQWLAEKAGHAQSV